MLPFTERVIAIIRHIPRGKVLTYGVVARAAGHPRAARQVSYIIHSCSVKYRLPWHRIINSRGEISLQGEALFRQRQLLEEEGVVFSGSRIDLDRFLWDVPPGFVSF